MIECVCVCVCVCVRGLIYTYEERRRIKQAIHS